MPEKRDLVLEEFEKEPRFHPAWAEFEAWAEDNGVSLEEIEDWEFNWSCFLTGYNVGHNAGSYEERLFLKRLLVALCQTTDPWKLIEDGFVKRELFNRFQIGERNA